MLTFYTIIVLYYPDQVQMINYSSGFLKNKDLLFIFVTVCVLLCAVPKEARRGHQISRAGVRGFCESPNMDAGILL